MLIAFDKDSLLRELYFPHVGQENHVGGAYFRLGIWINGTFSWVPDGWSVERRYLPDTLVTDVTLTGRGLKITINDVVDFQENIYLKKFHVQNLEADIKEVRLFLGQDFHIYGNDIGDTALFKPDISALIHYKGERYFLINILANNSFGVRHFATGKKGTGSLSGTWRDAEDGRLEGNPIAQGSVDSVLEIPLTLQGGASDVCYYWIACGKCGEEVKRLDHLVKKKTPESFFKRTSDYWKRWVDKDSLNYSLLPDKVARLYRQSLLICRTQMNNCGSIIAANDSDAIHYNQDTYSYMWPRDGALVANAFDLAGFESTQLFYQFCATIVEKEGFFLHKYTPTGAVASSWHPWVKENRPQLPIQEDETALVLFALWQHYDRFKNLEFVKPLYHSLIRKAADFMMNYRDLSTGLPLPSFDLWEERQGVLTFTVSAVFGGLMAAANFARLFGEMDVAKEYTQGAEAILNAMDRYLYLPEEKRFARMINFKKDGHLEVDKVIDASLFALFAFGAYSPDDPKVVSTMEQVFDKLQVKTASGGLIRYEDDPYYRYQETGSSNPWVVTTLWYAQYLIARAKGKEDLTGAKNILEWVADRALPSGVLAEQIHPVTGEPLSVSPLTWSHATLITTVQRYMDKAIEIEKCPTCGQPIHLKRVKSTP